MNTVRGRAFAWLGHPVTVAALALLIVNDHVLKAACPGWVTGKLSDVAGMLVAPPLLAALAGLVAPRRWVPVAAIVAVGVGFTVVKTWSYGAQLASGAWSLVTPSLVRADPTDLLALPFLALAWWVARQPPRPAPRWLRAMRMAVFLPLALAGVAATSAIPTPVADRVFIGADGALYLGADAPRQPLKWVVSRDGRTFEPSPEPVGPESPECSRAEPVTCYRPVHQRMAVESRTGEGPWQVSWELTSEQVNGLEQVYPHPESIRLWSEMLAVLEVPGGHVVAVANGRDGFAVRDVDGTWRRIGFPTLPDDLAPVAIAAAEDRLRQIEKENARYLILVLALLLGGSVLIAVSMVRAFRAGSRFLWLLLIPHLGVGSLVLLLAAGRARGNVLPIGFYIIGTLLLLVLTVVFGSSAMTDARVPFRQAAGAFGLVVGAFAAAGLVWEVAGAGRVETAAILAVAAAGVVTPAVAGHLQVSFSRTPVRGS